LIEGTDKPPFGSAVKTKVDKVIAATKAIRQEEKSADTLFTLEYILCMMRTVVVNS
jgi:hypothetical protein